MSLIGMVVPVAFGVNTLPPGWAWCDGGLRDRIADAALFAVIGETFGAGDGSTTYGLPDLSLKTAVGSGAGPRTSPYAIGDVAGARFHTLTVFEIPAHQHDLRASSVLADKAAPTAIALGSSTVFFGTSDGSNMDASTIGAAGQDQEHDNMPPYLLVRYMIALEEPTSMEPELGEIIIVPFAAGSGYHDCDGADLSRTTFADLYALFGTTYGIGDGSTTFTLPDFRGRVPLGAGFEYPRGPMPFGGWPPPPLHGLGESGGVENVTLNETQIPSHRHLITATRLGADTISPNGASFARTTDMYSATPTDSSLGTDAIRVAGGGDPHENRMPCIAFNFIIKVTV